MVNHIKEIAGVVKDKVSGTDLDLILGAQQTQGRAAPHNQRVPYTDTSVCDKWLSSSEGMDGTKLVKLMGNPGRRKDKVSGAELDLILARNKHKGERRLTINEFRTPIPRSATSGYRRVRAWMGQSWSSSSRKSRASSVKGFPQRPVNSRCRVDHLSPAETSRFLDLAPGTLQESVVYRLNALEDKVSGTELDLILARNKGRAGLTSSETTSWERPRSRFLDVAPGTLQESVVDRLNALEDKASGTELDLRLARNKGRAGLTSSETTSW